MNLMDRLEFEGIKIASMKKRVLAFILDEIIISILFYLIYSDAFEAALDLEQINALIASLLWQVVFLRVLYQGFFTWYFGASLGKMALKIAVVDVKGLYKPSLGASIIRACVRVVSEMCFYLGFVWAFNSPLRQSWEDLAAKTAVIDVEK